MIDIDERVVRFLAAAQAHPQLDGDLPRFRSAMAGHLRNAGPRRPLAEVRDLRIDGGAVRIYRPDRSAGHPVLVYLHGGAFLRGDLETADVACREIAARAPAVVVSVDYRLAPEHPFPAAVEDAVTALEWVAASGAAAHGGDPGSVSIGGDSAGANIAAVVAGGTSVPLRAQLLLGGVFDLVDDLAAVEPDVADVVDVTADNERLSWIARLYAGSADPADPRLSPLRAERLAGPPALVVTSQLDPFAPQARRLATRFQAGGTSVRLVEFPGMPHGFGNLAGLFEAEATQLYELVAGALRDGVPPGERAGWHPQRAEH
ncbi:alpha/beta hydrolase [Amycolatopsis endophytica]|uniref:Acetyl esterase n=1 Tax=Amycolatopsis endophytica TaxID=860233 RepID=A0A853BCJ5_9PSEU|nr:alpha/beta hydrolase [Amycolatopsis endophytica]NYI92391.1 acetyl esterase [Amycolatopsis endophytica]